MVWEQANIHLNWQCFMVWEKAISYLNWQFVMVLEQIKIKIKLKQYPNTLPYHI
jgi:hypothetical protein